MNTAQAEILPFKMEQKLKHGTLTPDTRVYAGPFLPDLPDVVVLLLFLDIFPVAVAKVNK